VRNLEPFGTVSKREFPEAGNSGSESGFPCSEPLLDGLRFFVKLWRMYDSHIDIELNDRWIRMVFIPFFGFVIPNATGMIDNSQYSWWELWLCYGYFMFISFAIWQGNRYLLFRLRPRFSWLNQPVHKVIALIVSNVFYTIPITVGLVVLWFAFARHSATDWDVVFKATALCVVCVVFITHTYETVFLIRSWESDRSRSESLEQARIKAELEALKNQIDPHFIFNSLNTLSHLIESDPAKAKQFNEHLADVYRYILLNKERDLVLLREELDFAHHYFSLLRIRFSDAMDLRTDFNGTASEDYLLPPISLQVLIENAVKHNEFSDAHPIRINLRLEDESIVVSNILRHKKGSRPSSRVGLKNLNDRYKVVTGMGIDVRDDHTTFEVRLPLLKLKA